MDPHDTEAHVVWARKIWSAAQPYATPAAYVNYLDQGDEHRTEAVYGGNFARLCAIKRTYDLDNIFLYNAKFRPLEPSTVPSGAVPPLDEPCLRNDPAC